jgi:hypothetical protein
MKKRISMLLAAALIISALCATSASAAAANTASAPSVRVNGYIVKFPDAQPYVDENNRTMIPVRCVTEQLGATVDWNDKASTIVTITKDDISLVITIGDPNIQVTENGKSTIVPMDTKAVLRDNRVYVPIRFVAEALGAYVDYSDVYSVVGIYSDELTAAQTTKLRACPYTQSAHAISYNTAKAEDSAKDLAYYYGTDRDSFSGTNGYANSREHLYNCISRISTYPFKAIDKVLKGGTNDEFFDLVVQEAKAEIGYSSDNIKFELIADSSCLYQEDNGNAITATVRGIVVMTCHIKATSLTGNEMAMVNRYGFTQINQDVTEYIPVDIHMNTQPDYNVNINTIVPLDSQYT